MSAGRRLGPAARGDGFLAPQWRSFDRPVEPVNAFSGPGIVTTYIRALPYLVTAFIPFTPPSVTVPSTVFSVATPPTVYTRVLSYPSTCWLPPPPVSNTVTIDKWQVPPQQAASRRLPLPESRSEVPLLPFPQFTFGSRQQPPQSAPTRARFTIPSTANDGFTLPLTVGNTITLDQYHFLPPQAPQRLRPPASTAGDGFSLPLTVGNTITLDKYHVQPPLAAQRIRTPELVASQQVPFLAFPTFTQTWQQPERAFNRGTLLPLSSDQGWLYPSFVDNNVTLDKWQVHPPLAVQRLRLPPDTATWQFISTFVDNNVTLDKWQVHPPGANDRRKLPASTANDGFTLPLTVSNTITLDKYHIQLPLATQRIRLLSDTNIWQFISTFADNNVTLDKWQVNPLSASDRRKLPVSTANDGFSLLLTVGNTVTIDKYHVLPPQTVRRLRPPYSTADYQYYPFFIDNTVTLDKWQVQPPGIAIRRTAPQKSTAGDGFSLPLTTVNTITLDKYMPPPYQAATRVPMVRLTIGYAYPIQALPIFTTEWLQPPIAAQRRLTLPPLDVSWTPLASFAFADNTAPFFNIDTPIPKRYRPYYSPPSPYSYPPAPFVANTTTPDKWMTQPPGAPRQRGLARLVPHWQYFVPFQPNTYPFPVNTPPPPLLVTRSAPYLGSVSVFTPFNLTTWGWTVQPPQAPNRLTLPRLSISWYPLVTLPPPPVPLPPGWIMEDAATDTWTLEAPETQNWVMEGTVTATWTQEVVAVGFNWIEEDPGEDTWIMEDELT